MRKIGKKQKFRKIQKIFFSVPFIIILGVVCSLTVNAAWNIHKKVRDTEKNLAVVTETYNELKDRESELAAKIESLETPLGVEAAIREKFGLVKEGEEVVMVIDQLEENMESDDDSSDNKTFWEKIKEWF